MNKKEVKYKIQNRRGCDSLNGGIKMKKRTKVLACLLATGMIFSGINVYAEDQTTDQEVTTEEATTAEATAADASEEDAVVATVNGEEIRQSQLTVMTNYMLQQYQNSGYDVSNETIQNYVSEAALNMLIQLKVIELKSQELKLDEFTEEELEDLRNQAQEQWDESLEIYKALYMAQDASLEEEDAQEKAQEVMAQYGYETSDDVFEEMKNEEVFNRVEEYCVGDVSISDEEVKETYDEYVAMDEESFADNVPLYEQTIAAYGSNESFYSPEGYRHFTHIRLTGDEEKLEELQALMYPEESATAADATAADAENEAAIAELKDEILAEVQDTVDEIEEKFNDGESFDDLIDEYSVDAELSNYSGCSVHKDSIFWEQDFIDGAMAVEEIGQISDPIVCSDGVYVLYYDYDAQGGPIEYTDTVKENLRSVLLNQAQNENFSATIQEWCEECEIEIL